MDLSTIPTSRLVNDHAAACRWLDLPFADRWPEQKAEREAFVKASWVEITRRRENPEAITMAVEAAENGRMAA